MPCCSPPDRPYRADLAVLAPPAVRVDRTGHSHPANGVWAAWYLRCSAEIADDLAAGCSSPRRSARGASGGGGHLEGGPDGGRFRLFCACKVRGAAGIRACKQEGPPSLRAPASPAHAHRVCSCAPAEHGRRPSAHWKNAASPRSEFRQASACRLPRRVPCCSRCCLLLPRSPPVNALVLRPGSHCSNVFTIHGLWPSNYSGSHPDSCNKEWTFKKEVSVGCCSLLAASCGIGFRSCAMLTAIVVLCCTFCGGDLRACTAGGSQAVANFT